MTIKIKKVLAGFALAAFVLVVPATCQGSGGQVRTGDCPKGYHVADNTWTLQCVRNR